jgi:arylsulfatase A-like enzyme
VTQTVGLVDVAPTILDLLELSALDDADGRSLLPLMRGERPTPPSYEMETFYPSLAYGWAPLRALCSGPYKYIEAPAPELYELPTDPREDARPLAPEGGRREPRADGARRRSRRSHTRRLEHRRG